MILVSSIVLSGSDNTISLPAELTAPTIDTGLGNTVSNRT